MSFYLSSMWRPHLLQLLYTLDVIFVFFGLASSEHSYIHHLTNGVSFNITYRL